HLFIFFFQAEDGIRDRNVTGVQTCALPIYLICAPPWPLTSDAVEEVTVTTAGNTADVSGQGGAQIKFVTRSGSNRFAGSVYEYRSEERRVGKEWRGRCVSEDDMGVVWLEGM